MSMNDWTNYKQVHLTPVEDFASRVATRMWPSGNTLTGHKAASRGLSGSWPWPWQGKAWPVDFNVDVEAQPNAFIVD